MDTKDDQSILCLKSKKGQGRPYSRVLLSAIPIPDPDIEGKKKIVPVEGEVPSPIDPPDGCPFCGRCSEAMDICNECKPEWKEIKEKHYVACHLYNNR